MRDGTSDATGSARPPGPLPHRARQPARQGGHSSATATAPSGSSSATTRPKPSATRPSASRRSPDSQTELARIETARQKAKPQGRRRASKAECALRAHPTLGRYLRHTQTGRLPIDRAKIDAEERLDGKFLISTSDPDISAEDVALGYKNLLEAERGFRDLKGTLELRPVFHRLERASAPTSSSAGSRS